MTSSTHTAALLALGLAAASVFPVLRTRDRGVDQAAVAGNAGPWGADRDPRINLRGAAGKRTAARG